MWKLDLVVLGERGSWLLLIEMLSRVDRKQNRLGSQGVRRNRSCCDPKGLSPKALLASLRWTQKSMLRERKGRPGLGASTQAESRREDSVPTHKHP